MTTVYHPRNLFLSGKQGKKVEINVLDEGKYKDAPAYQFHLENNENIHESYNYWFYNLFEGIEWMMDKIDGDVFDEIWEWFLSYGGTGKREG